MTTYSAIRHFRKVALFAVFALAAGVSISVSAQAVKVNTRNYNFGVKAVWIQNETNPNGWAFFPVAAPQRMNNGRVIPGLGGGPEILYGTPYSVYALSSTDCTEGGQRINRLSSHYYRVSGPKVTSTMITITNAMLSVSP